MVTGEVDFPELQEAVRALTDDVLIPAEDQMVADGRVSERSLAALRDLGLFGMTLPREHGGLGLGMEEQVRLTFEFTRASAVYRSHLSTTFGLVSRVLVDYGTPEQQRAWLPRFATGEATAAFALTEEAAGSDATALAAVARRTAGGYRLTGSKRYITNGHTASVLMVFAVVPEHGITAFLVPRPAAGLSARLPSRMNGHAENPVAYVELDEVWVPDAAVVGAPGEGMRLALAGINHARTHVAATAVGQGTRLLQEATRHVATREQFGAPLAELGSVQAMLGRSLAELAAARELTLACSRAWDRGEPDRHQIAAAKLYATEMVGQVADRAVQVLGGAGIVGDSPVPRMWRDVRALRIYEGASEIHERNLARHLVTLDRHGLPLWTG